MKHIIQCPHCSIYCEIIEFNCCIFRCGVYKYSGKQIPPHLSKVECDELKKKDEIYGCGKPFRIVIQDKTIQVVVCNYI